MFYLEIEYQKDGYRFFITESKTDMMVSLPNLSECQQKDIDRLISTREPAIGISSSTHEAWLYSGIEGHLDEVLKPLAEKWFAKVGMLRWIHRLTPIENDLRWQGFSKIENHRSGLTIWKASTEYDNALVAVHQGQIIKKGCWEIYGNQYVSAYQEFYEFLLDKDLLDGLNSAIGREKRKEWEAKHLATR